MSKTTISTPRRFGGRRLTRLAAVVALALSVMAVGHQKPAEAAPAAVTITDVTIRNAGTPFQGFDSTSRKAITASCPSGERLLSGGAKVMTDSGGSAFGHVLLYALVPGTSTYTARATETPEGYSENWRLIAYAVCAPVPSTLGVEVVSRTSAEDLKLGPSGDYVNDVAAPCPTGKRIIGTGGILGSPAGLPPGDVSFQQIRPNQQGAYAFVQGVLELSGRVGLAWGDFRVTAYAVCAYPIQGWHVVIDGTDLDNARLQIAQVECDGQQLIGGGLTKGDVYGRAHVETMEPIGSSFQRLTIIGGIRDPWSTYNWNLAAWAICVDR